MSDYPIKILAFSDLHYGREIHVSKSKQRSFGSALLDSLIHADPTDILYFGGDLSWIPNGNLEHFHNALSILSRYPAKHKLFTLGNNDLLAIQKSQLGRHYGELSAVLKTYGFHLLDDSPFIYNGIAFVGNIGWHDGSLSRSKDLLLDPSKEHALFTKIHGDRIGQNYTSSDFFEECYSKICSQLHTLEKDPSVKGIVLGIHYVPDRKLIAEKEGLSEEKIWYYGSKKYRKLFCGKKIILGLVGHTHRSASAHFGNTLVENISGPDQPKMYQIHLSDKRIIVKKV